jgi:acyl carrier protein
LPKSQLSRDEIFDACVKSLAETLRISPDRIEMDTKFSRLGLDSGLSVFLLLELEDRLGITLVPEAIYDNQTVAELCEHIAGIVGHAKSPEPQPGESPAQ